MFRRYRFVKKALTIGGVIVLVLVLVGAGATFLRGANSSLEAQATPASIPVTLGSIEEVVSATGNVSAERQATLAFETSGPIAEVLITEGEQVKAGDILARLDTTSLEWQVARSQASLDTAQARLEQAQEPASEEDLASAQAALDSATANYAKVKEGASAEDLAAAQAALDSAIASYDKLKAGPTTEELASAQAAVDSARAAVQQAQAAYDRIKNQPDVQMRQEALNLQNATIELERAQANYDAVAKGASQSEIAAAEAQIAQARANLAQLQEKPTASELASAEAQVAQAEASLAQLQERPKAEDVAVSRAQVKEAQAALEQAQSQLEDALIVAPFDGTILNIQIEAGEWATPGTPAIELAVTRPQILDVNVDEVDVAQLALGQNAHISFDAIKGHKIDGIVSHIAPSSTNIGGAVAYGVEVSFDPGDLPIRLGMTAEVDIVIASEDQALLVPNRAIEADRAANRYYVTRLKPDGTTERIEVRIGLRDGTNTQIVDGLNEGDRLLLPEVPEQSQTEPSFGPGGSGGGRPLGGGGG